MPDPTESVIIASFCSALGIFAITATARKLLEKPSLDLPEEEPVPQEDEWPYLTPTTEEEPPPLPVGKVPTWFYRPLDLLGIGFVFMTFFGLVVASIRTAEKSDVVLDSGALIISIAFQFITAGIVTAFVITRIRPVEWLGLRWKSWPWVFLIAPCAVVFMWLFFGGLQVSGFMKWMESLGVDSVQDTVKLLQESTDPLALGLMAAAAVFAAPICEEIVFRGYLYPAAKKFTGPWVAGICSALVFGAAHGSMAALLPLFVFGCVLVFIYEKTGSIWAPMAVHFCFNGATVLIQLAVRYLPHDLT
ncbi:MAG: type II CAAX endopeptidase family protein [Luteolibacter sp.]|uniref:type II CAAX endopeptidase family protein n=1 Tax=Luteolibacter sp. TaxID=1962973 RepID=UPI003265737F